MGVPCPGCGREYDVALFPFGRTLHCTCGRRVGVAPRVRAARPDPIRFIADAMLGKLARWLRILGFDTAYEAHIADAELVRRAFEEQRVVLTRDRALLEEWRAPHVYLVRQEGGLEPLREVAEAFGLARRVRLFTRCNRCNTPLVGASRDEARGAVPERILALHDAFQRCPGCARVYWHGSHAERMLRVVDHALREPAPPLRTGPTLADVDWTRWQPRQRATILFVIRGDRILLIEKKRGLGAGKINGPGGRIEPGESPLRGAIREVQEELRVTPTGVRACGELRFQFTDGLTIHGYVFAASGCEGEPQETDEARPLWTPLDRIPYERMWADDRLWMPLLLAGRCFDGRILFDRDVMLDHEVRALPEPGARELAGRVQ